MQNSVVRPKRQKIISPTRQNTLNLSAVTETGKMCTRVIAGPWLGLLLG